MEIKNFDKKYINEIVKLWNESVVPYSVYKPFTCESFEDKFLKNKYFADEGTKLAFIDNKLVGFGNAIINNQDKSSELTPGYITCVAVCKDHQRKGIGSKILNELEKYLKDNGKTVVRNFFGNPINLEWYVPNTNKHDHPGTPAVPFNTPYYFLFMNNGYNVSGHIDAFHLDITSYELPQKVVDRMTENEKNGYTITMYDKDKHYGFKELFEALHNEGWHNAVKNNLAKENPSPMLIAQKDGEILGWTGPLYTQESGRGYFAGIGVHPKIQSIGLGKALFCNLCYESKKNGAKFMTLFTGSDNLARNIYLYAGFRIVQSFSILKKELK